MPAGNLSASMDTYIPIEAVPSKYQDKFNRGLMSCCQWLHLFVDAMHDVSFKEFEDMPQEELKEQVGAEEEHSYQHNSVEEKVIGGGDREAITVFEYADDLDGLGYDMEWGVLVPPMREQHMALEMLRAAMVLVVGERDNAIQLLQGVLT